MSFRIFTARERRKETARIVHTWLTVVARAIVWRQTPHLAFPPLADHGCPFGIYPKEKHMTEKKKLKKLSVKDVANLKAGKGGTCISGINAKDSRVWSDPGCSIGTCGGSKATSR